MRFVGFPEGLQETEENLERWLEGIASARPQTNHYSIYEDGMYCGETFYSIDPDTLSASMDIKLFPAARGRGIASQALRFAIGEAFRNGALRCWVDPNPENSKAIALYQRLGMKQKPMPAQLAQTEYPGFLYFELSRPEENQPKSGEISEKLES